jgi:two-component system NtrC family sensor kinase
MVLVSAIILYQYRNSYHEKVHDHLEALVKKHKQNIDSFLKEKLADIRFLANTFSYEELSDESFLRDQLASLQREFGPVFVDLGVINSRGIQVAYAGPFMLDKALYSSAGWFQKAIGNPYFISDVFLGLRGLPHFIVTVKDNWKGDSWILRATIDFVAFNHLVSNIRIGETGFAFIVNREGEFQTKPFLDIVPKSDTYKNILLNDKRNEEVEIIEKDDHTGNRNLYVSALLKNGEWILVYQQDASDAYKDIRIAAEVTLLIVLLGGLGIVTTALLVSRRMAKRMIRADQEKNMMTRQIVETGKLASVGELAAGIAHEINNPVAIMVEEAGWIGDLLEEEEFSEGENLQEFRRALDQIRTQGKRCKEITHKLLSFARKTDSKIQEVQLNDLMEEMVSLSAQRAKYANVEIKTNYWASLPSIHISQSELQQVFLNIINNALDAMEQKGGTLRIKTLMDGNYLAVDISDTGTGIPEANLGRIFDPFFTTKSVGKGTGLGLSICYGIVKKMGGDISVHSVVDMGTTFRILLPVDGEKQSDNQKDPSDSHRID